MKLLLVAASFSLIASDAYALSRHDITDLTCAKVQALIESEGAVILTYSSKRILGLPIYDRYASSQQYCAGGEVAAATGVPTVDEKYCPVKKCFASDIFIAK